MQYDVIVSSALFLTIFFFIYNFLTCLFEFRYQNRKPTFIKETLIVKIQNVPIFVATVENSGLTMIYRRRALKSRIEIIAVVKSPS